MTILYDSYNKSLEDYLEEYYKDCEIYWGEDEYYGTWNKISKIFFDDFLLWLTDKEKWQSMNETGETK